MSDVVSLGVMGIWDDLYGARLKSLIERIELKESGSCFGVMNSN